MRTIVGTNGWAVLGGGVRPRDRVRLVGQMLMDQMTLLPRRVRRRLGLSDRRFRHVDPDAVPFPDSAIVLQAVEQARRLSEPWLFNHCMRTYVWGGLLAQMDRIAFDAEMLFVASVLHDLGLTAEHWCRDARCSCFAVEGAQAARRFAVEQGWGPAQVDRLAEAICLHMNVRVSLRHGAEAHLLHAGAALDVVGARIRQLGASVVVAVLERYPLMNFKNQMAGAMQRQADARPTSRAAFLARWGFIDMIRTASSERYLLRPRGAPPGARPD